MTQVVIPDVIESLRSGNLVVRKDAPLPGSVKIEGPLVVGEWMLVSQVRPAELDRQLNSVGWYFFFLPPEIQAGALALDRDRKHALAKALRKLLARAEAEKVNTLEITRVKTKEFPGFLYASLRGYMRHIQQSPLLFRTAEEVHQQILRRAA